MFTQIAKFFLIFAMIALIFENHTYAIPVRLSKFQSSQKNFVQELWVIGDRHDLKAESSVDGKKRTKWMSSWFDAQKNNPRYQKTKLVWEVSDEFLQRVFDSNARPKVPLFLLEEPIRFRKQFTFSNSKVQFTPADNWRSTDSDLRKIWVDSIVSPTSSMHFLSKYKNRLSLSQKISRSLQPVITASRQKLTHPGPNNSQSLFSKQIARTLNEHHAQLEKNLEKFQKLLQSKKPTSTKNLSRCAAKISRILEDTELLTHCLTAKQQRVILYAGDAHVRRLIPTIRKLGFQLKKEVKAPRNKLLSYAEITEFDKLSKPKA